MNRKKFRNIILLGFLSIIIFLFIRGFYIDKQSYKESLNGIIIKREDGSKGSIILLLKTDSHSKKYSRYIVGPTTVDEKIMVGDSIVKSQNSYMLYLYKKANIRYYLDDSSEINHW